eukprot:TRINITY_DN90982_c0_g1_i1.p1 TRINITY_DN90982_c0_g1~~TRINITY_DN90982_c0_g1_i1.p1  ORF type:complete len:181 (-),score=36.01 TRINITY_DN90982_c0_g1_i1:121-663(-)
MHAALCTATRRGGYAVGWQIAGCTERGGRAFSDIATATGALGARGPLRLRLRGLPFTATAEQVYGFFEGFQVFPGGPNRRAVEMIRLRNRPSGQAYVYFGDVVEAMKAKDALDGRAWGLIGSRVYRVEVLEDFPGRAIVKEEDNPGDIIEEKLKDEARRLMFGNGHKEREQRKEMVIQRY